MVNFHLSQIFLPLIVYLQSPSSSPLSISHTLSILREIVNISPALTISNNYTLSPSSSSLLCTVHSHFYLCSFPLFSIYSYSYSCLQITVETENVMVATHAAIVFSTVAHASTQRARRHLSACVRRMALAQMACARARVGGVGLHATSVVLVTFFNFILFYLIFFNFAPFYASIFPLLSSPSSVSPSPSLLLPPAHLFPSLLYSHIICRYQCGSDCEPFVPHHQYVTDRQ